MERDYCKIFFDSELDHDTLLCLFCDTFGGTHTHLSNIHFDWGDCYFYYNDYYSPAEHDAAPDDFIYWRYYLEFHDEKNDFRSFSEGLVCLSRKLSDMGIKNVASCDFEEIFG